MREKGFTLIELLVTLGILSVVSLVVIRTVVMYSGTAQQGVSDKLILQMESRKAADQIAEIIHEGSDVVRPLIGESSPFMVLKNSINQLCVVYLDQDEANTKLLKKPLYKLIFYTSDFSGVYKKTQEKVLCSSVKRATFTALNPFGVIADITLANAHGEFQFVTHLGLMNLGDVE